MMVSSWFGIRDGLATAGRLPAIAREHERISALEIALLIFCGAAAAAASGYIRLGLRFPGHSIVLSMLPMALGLALAPRKLAGFIMSAGAFSTASVFNATGLANYGSGAFVSLCLIGPAMDLAVSRLQSGWKLYSGLILAGISANLLALASRSASKLFGLDLIGRRPFGSWWAEAAVTYVISGAIAGLIAAICFFNMRNNKSQSETADRGMHA